MRLGRWAARCSRRSCRSTTLVWWTCTDSSSRGCITACSTPERRPLIGPHLSTQGEAAMYAITGITGKVGGAVARTLLAAGQPVRAVVRDAARARSWAELGCEVVTADMDDAATLTAAFEGTQGVFILPPSEFDPSPGFPEARAVIDAVRGALQSAAPGRWSACRRSARRPPRPICSRNVR